MKKIIYDLDKIGVAYRKIGRVPWKSNKFWALEDVSFKVLEGETLGVIGKNGAGKSTLLRLLGGLIVPDRGRIFRADVKSTVLSLGVGFDMRITGKDNIILSGLLLGFKKRHLYKIMPQIIELADLGDFINEPIITYSEGMKARLGFAIAYYAETDVILLDEALAPGDQEFRKKAADMIKKKMKSENQTVVFVSHEMDLIHELCDRVVKVENHKVVSSKFTSQTHC